MKRVIRASEATVNVIFEDEYFQLVERFGTSISGEPYSHLQIMTKRGTLAEKHVVEIRLNTDYDEARDAEYYSPYIAHGMRSVMDTLDETAEYIEVLEDALDFAEKVNAYLGK